MTHKQTFILMKPGNVAHTYTMYNCTRWLRLSNTQRTAGSQMAGRGSEEDAGDSEESNEYKGWEGSEEDDEVCVSTDDVESEGSD